MIHSPNRDSPRGFLLCTTAVAEGEVRAPVKLVYPPSPPPPVSSYCFSFQVDSYAVFLTVSCFIEFLCFFCPSCMFSYLS